MLALEPISVRRVGAGVGAGSWCRTEGGGSRSQGVFLPPRGFYLTFHRVAKTPPHAPPSLRHKVPPDTRPRGRGAKKRLGTATPNRRAGVGLSPAGRSGDAVLRRSPKEAILRYCMLPQGRNAKCKEHFGVSKLTPNL